MRIQKSFLALTALMGLWGGNAHARITDCYTGEVAAYIMILSVTSAPTGSTLLTVNSFDCRDQILNVKEDAIGYMMTGQVSPILESAITEVKKMRPEMDEEDIISGFFNIK